MSLPSTYTGRNGLGISITITPPGSSSAAIPLDMILKWQPPTREYKGSQYIPQNGTLAGLEQNVTGSQKASPASASVLYEKAHQQEFDLVSGIDGCTIVFTFGDGLRCTGVGSMQKIDIPQQQDSQIMESDLNFMLNAGWTWSNVSGSSSGS